MRRYILSQLGEKRLQELCRRNPIHDEEILSTCRSVFQAVADQGDEAVRAFTRKYDKVDLECFESDPGEWTRAKALVQAQTQAALEQAADNIRRFHAAQVEARQDVVVQNGVLCWREARPIDPVGLYIPGGNAVLPSTVLMLAVPARLAGCKQIVLCVPPRPDGSVAPEVLAAASVAGVTRVFKIGGAQAVAAMTLGTQTIPQVNKILGPGNRWVQAAKLMATTYGVAIDMVAGPSEVLVIADSTADPELVASDLIAQAEHGSDSQAVLVSTSEELITSSLNALERQIRDLPRRAFAADALAQSFAIQVDRLEQAFEVSNRYAPEHLILHIESPRQWLEYVRSAGSVFLGPWSPEVAGDYASGTNHTLPTSGLAKAFSGVSVDSFVKKITFQELSREGLNCLRPVLETLATVEGLEGHRRAVAKRFRED